MRKLTLLFIILTLFPGPYCPEIFSKQFKDVTSEHLLIRLPKERAVLGRSVITDLERFYRFLNGAIDADLPGKIIFLVDWDREMSSTNYQQSSIIVGMNRTAAANPGNYRGGRGSKRR